MKNTKTDKLVFMIIIAGRRHKDDLLRALFESGVKMTNTAYGKGSVKASYLKNILGLVPEEHKAIITCLMPRGKAQGIMQMLIGRFGFDKPNTGIAFTIPVDRLSF